MHRCVFLQAERYLVNIAVDVHVMLSKNLLVVRVSTVADRRHYGGREGPSGSEPDMMAMERCYSALLDQGVEYNATL